MHIVISMEKPGISQGWQHFPFDPQAIPAVLLRKQPKALKAFKLRLRCTILLRSISHDWEFSASLCVGTATLPHPSPPSGQRGTELLVGDALNMA